MITGLGNSALAIRCALSYCTVARAPSGHGNIDTTSIRAHDSASELYFRPAFWADAGSVAGEVVGTFPAQVVFLQQGAMSLGA